MDLTNSIDFKSDHKKVIYALLNTHNPLVIIILSLLYSTALKRKITLRMITTKKNIMSQYFSACAAPKPITTENNIGIELFHICDLILIIS